jgi:O-antigen/teichoic acid export membrane protein
MRSLLFLALVGLWIALGFPGVTVALALSLGEATLLVGLGAFFILRDGLRVPADWRERAKSLMRFGASAMPSVAFSDLNGRIDVLVLGLFAAPEAIGVYTIAAWLAPGAVLLRVAVRPLVNARLASLTSAGAHAELRAMVRRIGLLTAAALITLMGALCLAYPFIATWLLGDPRYAGALAPLLILSAGVVIASPVLPFDLLLAQSGRPGAHSRFKAAVMLTNLVLALLLVPRFGAIGAAIAYAASFVTYALWLRTAVRRHIGPVM